MALFGVVFALGAGSAAAQLTLDVADKVAEGSDVTLTVGGTITITDGTAAGTITVSATAAAGTASGMVTEGEDGDLTGFRSVTIATPANDDGDGDATVTLTPHTFIWAVGTDPDAEDEAVALTLTVAGAVGGVTATPPAAEAVTIEDTHTQSFVWSPAAPTLKEGETVQVSLTAIPTPVQLSYDTTLVVEGATGYTVMPTSFTFDAAEGTPGEDGPSATITITAPANDSNRAPDTITLRALETGTVTDRADPLSITVEDLHKLPEITAKLTDEDGDEITSAAEGDDVTLTFSVAAAATEAIKITLSEAAASTAERPGDYDWDTNEATIASGATTSSEVTLTVEMNGDIGPEMIVLDGMVTGADANGTAAGDPVTVTLAITDGTMPNVTPKTEAEIMKVVTDKRTAAAGSDGRWTADDDDLDFQADDFFNLPMAGFDVSVTPSSSNPNAVYTGTDVNNIWVGANENNTPGESTISVTAVVSPLST
ncbi:MAG: hypothetical protein OXC29_23605, partial [Rhodococcus sp.]|nr:hypothetical protein [Rhodococcus sp. (in: high G+C Gram-positive bacteria)]